MSARAVFTSVAAVAALALPTGALAATSQQIFSDAADGHLDRSYSSSDLRRAMKDSTVQGYGNPIIQITLKNTVNNRNSNSNTNTVTSSSTSNANAAANASCGPGSASASNSGASSSSNSNGGSSCSAPPTKHVFTPPVRRSQSGGGGGTLPFTGSNLATFLSLGFVLLAGGGILRMLARRRGIAG